MVKIYMIKLIPMIFFCHNLTLLKQLPSPSRKKKKLKLFERNERKRESEKGATGGVLMEKS